MRRIYRVTNFTSKPLALELQYEALDSGSVDAADVFTVDPPLGSGKLHSAQRSEEHLPVQNLALVINKGKLGRFDGPRFVAIIDSGERLLTTLAMMR